MFEDKYLGLVYRIGGAPVHYKDGFVLLQDWKVGDAIRTLIVHSFPCLAYITFLMVLDAFDVKT